MGFSKGAVGNTGRCKSTEHPSTEAFLQNLQKDLILEPGFVTEPQEEGPYARGFGVLDWGPVNSWSNQLPPSILPLKVAN